MTTKLFFILSALLFIFPKNMISQNACLNEKDKLLFNDYVAYITPFEKEPMEFVLEKTSEFFLETPYVDNTLDQSESEMLVINLRGLDCVTYVENVLALSFAVHNNNLSESSFLNNLKRIRYRNNEIIDFASRIHYTSDWIYENQANNLIENISKELIGERETKRVDFMSSHRSAYKQIAENDVIYNKIVEMEQSINKRGGFYYLPKYLIESKFDDIPHMAVIAFVTAIEGLDTSHIGLAYKKNERLTFIHASSAKQKVVIDDKSLSEYCLSQKNCKGIIIAKVL